MKFRLLFETSRPTNIYHFAYINGFSLFFNLAITQFVGNNKQFWFSFHFDRLKKKIFFIDNKWEWKKEKSKV